MTDILWKSTEENVNWGEWVEVEKLPPLHRLTRWWQKRVRGYRYVVGLSWPRAWAGKAGANMDPNNPPPLICAVFGPVAQAQQQVIALLAVSGGIRGDIVLLAVSGYYDKAKEVALANAYRTKPRYEVSSAYPVEGGFDAVYTPMDS